MLLNNIYYYGLFIAMPISISNIISLGYVLDHKYYKINKFFIFFKYGLIGTFFGLLYPITFPSFYLYIYLKK